jgi:hypothetical protein
VAVVLVRAVSRSVAVVVAKVVAKTVVVAVAGSCACARVCGCGYDGSRLHAWYGIWWIRFFLLTMQLSPHNYYFNLCLICY